MGTAVWCARVDPRATSRSPRCWACTIGRRAPRNLWSVPEGDTIHRTAAALRTALVGRPLVSFTAPYLAGIAPERGRVIERIDSHGKHLELVWDDGIVLHTHMRLGGSWHLYRRGERWRRPQREMVVSVEVDEWNGVCFNAPIVETYRQLDKRRHPGFGHLGPDLIRDDADLDECVRRWAAFEDPDDAVAEVLLDQRVCCGVGNVFKSEVLWALALSPFAANGKLSDAERLEVVTSAATMLRANRDRVRRTTTTTTPAGLAAYGRNGNPCPTCGDTIRVRRTGRYQRSTYWCPSCQIRHEPRPEVEVTPSGLVRPADPHPAAVLFLDDLPTRKVHLFDDDEWPDDD
jgi:endonuclease VIII